MPVRMLSYIALLYQDLLRSGRVRRRGKLPIVLPVIVYTGPSRWRAPVTLREMLHSEPSAWKSHRPQLRCVLVDRRNIHRRAGWLPSARNLAVAVFRLESCRSTKEILEIANDLLQWLRSPEDQSLRCAFAIWIRKVMLARFPGTHYAKGTSWRRFAWIWISASRNGAKRIAGKDFVKANRRFCFDS